MLSELSLIDWAALLIAVVLLVVTAVAAYLTRTGLGSIPESATPSPVKYLSFQSRPPAHAATDREPSFRAPPPVLRRPQAPLTHARSTQPTGYTLSFAPTIIDLTNNDAPGSDSSEPPESAEQRSETVAERAARLRRGRASNRAANADAKRPVAESKATYNTTPTQPRDSVVGFSVRKPGFFDDPIGRHEQRYWDGSGWTEHCKEGADRFNDPL